MEWMIPVLLALSGLIVGAVVRHLLDGRVLANAQEEADRLVKSAREKADAVLRERVRTGRKGLEVKRAEREEEVDRGRQRIDRLEKRTDELARQHEVRSQRMRTKSRDMDLRKREFFRAQKEQRQAKKGVRASILSSQDKLCEIAELTLEGARDLHLSRLDDALTKECNRYSYIRAQTLEEELEDRARRILGITIQRCTFSHIVETSVSVTRFTDPSLRTKIAGKNGETLARIKELTGIEVIADEANPDIFFYSGYDGVAREVVRRTVDRLAKNPNFDLRTVDKLLKRFTKEVDRQIHQAGRGATQKMGLRRLHPELVHYMGRLQYRSSYGQNVLWHSMEVAYIAGLVAEELGINRRKARRGALLHDIGKAVSLEVEGGHPEIGADLAKKHGERPEIVAPIALHHESTGLTQLTELTRIGDSVSGSRPGARRDTSEKYLMRLEQIMTIVNSNPGIETSYSMQAGREIWVILDSEKVNDNAAREMAAKIAGEIEETVTYPGKIKVTMIREAKVYATAK